MQLWSKTIAQEVVRADGDWWRFPFPMANSSSHMPKGREHSTQKICNQNQSVGIKKGKMWSRKQWLTEKRFEWKWEHDLKQTCLNEKLSAALAKLMPSQSNVSSSATWQANWKRFPKWVNRGEWTGKIYHFINLSFDHFKILLVDNFFKQEIGFYAVQNIVAEQVRFWPAPGIFYTGSGSFKKVGFQPKTFYNIGTVPSSLL